MKIVFEWLREFVDVPVGAEDAARALALRGFEVAEVTHGLGVHGTSDTGNEPQTDAVIDFEVTANRPDCLSHIGFAREAAVVWNVSLQMPSLQAPPAGPGEAFDVRVEDTALCPRYCAQVFEVRMGASPGWLARRLEAAGLRAINNIVDVTNYVMLELGHPMHAFDLERLAGRTLIIRRAASGERLLTLDGFERELASDMLVIADAQRAVAIAGVMGGEESEVSSGTRLIALESAWFDPPSVRRTSRRLGLKTEASTRFERGADINAPPAGIARAAALLHQIGAGTLRGDVIDVYPRQRRPLQIRLRASRIARILGQEIPAGDVPPILTPLGFTVASANGAGGPAEPVPPTWTVTLPTFRLDVQREIDLIEEVGRHYGFDRLPVTFPALTAPQPPPDPRIGRERLVRRVLTAAGFSECMTFAFVERPAALPFCEPGVEPAPIANPLSEKFAVLRPSLLPGLLDACVYNRRRDRRDIQLFEAGARFTSRGEGRAIGLVWCGAADGPHWSAPTRPVDFFDVKGVVEQLAAAFGVDVACVADVYPFLAPGRAASVRQPVNGGSGRALGVAGQLAPAIAAARGFPSTEEIFVAELDLDALAELAPAADLKVRTLPRFPAILRDISILIDEALPAAAVRGTIRSAAPETLVSIVEFDRYQGKGVPEGRISLSLRLTFRAPDRTLTDAEAEQATTRIVDALRTAHGAERR